MKLPSDMAKDKSGNPMDKLSKKATNQVKTRFIRPKNFKFIFKEQIWSETSTTFKPLIGEAIAIRVSEGRKIGKAVVVGFAQEIVLF